MKIKERERPKPLPLTLVEKAESSTCTQEGGAEEARESYRIVFPVLWIPHFAYGSEIIPPLGKYIERAAKLLLVPIPAQLMATRGQHLWKLAGVPGDRREGTELEGTIRQE